MLLTFQVLHAAAAHTGQHATANAKARRVVAVNDGTFTALRLVGDLKQAIPIGTTASGNQWLTRSMIPPPFPYTVNGSAFFNVENPYAGLVSVTASSDSVRARARPHQ